MFSALILFSLLFMGLHFWGRGEEGAASSSLNEGFQISDLIPEGFVMVPIELKNHSALSDLISSFGVVDLYQQKPHKKEPHKLARAVRVVRLQTGRFSALIPESKAGSFVKHQSPFTAVVQHFDKKDSQIIIPRLKRRRSIHIEEPEP